MNCGVCEEHPANTEKNHIFSFAEIRVHTKWTIFHTTLNNETFRDKFLSTSSFPQKPEMNRESLLTISPHCMRAKHNRRCSLAAWFSCFFVFVFVMWRFLRKTSLKRIHNNVQTIVKAKSLDKHTEIRFWSRTWRSETSLGWGWESGSTPLHDPPRDQQTSRSCQSKKLSPTFCASNVAAVAVYEASNKFKQTNDKLSVTHPYLSKIFAYLNN